MTEPKSNQPILLALAKGATAQLRAVIVELADRDVARVVYTEVMQVARRLEVRHGFGKEKKR